MKLSNIESKEERLLARLISNVCRRNVTANEKTRILEALGKIYVAQGTKSGELAHRIAEKTRAHLNLVACVRSRNKLNVLSILGLHRLYCKKADNRGTHNSQ